MFATTAQIKALKTLFRKNDLNAEDEDRILAGYGVKSCTKLTIKSASSLITKLSEGLKKPDKKYTGKGTRGQQMHVTQLQAERIDLLQQLNGWGNQGLYKFIARQTGKNKPVQMLMNFEAVKVIVGMERVYAGKNRRLFLLVNKMTNAGIKALIKLSKEQPANQADGI
jgi:hypothetical protein